ncbi:MAG: Mrp/NBP35 family ATP-binding protein [Thermoguttaceae bacterium]|nr:Mrp/NBP35 family ATP-binding protein [Thermoguttaceae bacterium]MBR5757530.1 Mrp/NBP35 family ATP-binding protein [Thermoguttaceae bacterium]
MSGCSHDCGDNNGSGCSHDCSSCGENCPSRKDPKSFLEKPHEMSSIKNVVGVVSGKGGVGKSLVSALLACSTRRRGYEAAVLDADITGPSIPKAFGLSERMTGSEFGVMPVKTKTGVSVASINLLVDDPASPVVWRGPILAGAVKQFWTDVIWNDVDFMYVDMPPGTGDVPLTVFQSIPIKGIVVVATPQDLVSLIVEKAIKMAEMMNIPILALVENMSYYECPDCGKRHSIFGDSKIEEVAKKYGIDKIVKLPIDPAIAAACDHGEVESVVSPFIDETFDYLLTRFESLGNNK